MIFCLNLKVEGRVGISNKLKGFDWYIMRCGISIRRMHAKLRIN